MSIAKKSFGALPCGKEADLYILTNKRGASVEITNYGGILHAINVPDRDGNLANVLLGYPDVTGYIPTSGYLGALIGRVGNRIADGKFTLNGVEYQVEKNEKGRTCLHGGFHGFNEKIWDATPLEGICEDHLILKTVSPDGEGGFPGTLNVMVTYTFTDENELIIRYEAVSDKDTPCNLTNHAYFNLGGDGSGVINDFIFEINADTFTVVDDRLIPTGEQRDVTGTPFDFREPKRVGDGMALTATDPQLKLGGGYDHNFNINDEDMRFAACVTDPKTGRVMTVFTDMPAMQFYAGNYLNTSKPGSCGRKYGPNEAFCLETQYAPDSVNQPSFPDSVLRAGDKYDFTTVFAFDTDADEEE